MVEEDAVAGVHVVGLAVVDGDPVGVELGHRVGAARVKRRGLALRRLPHQTVEFRGRGLVEARFLLQAEKADRLEQAQGTHGDHVGGVFRRLETHRHMALRAQVVDLVRLHLVNDAGEVGRIGEIAVMEHELLLRHVRILVDVVHPLGVEQRRAPLDAMHLVPLFQQQFGQVRPVLTGHAGDQRPFLHSVSSLCIIDTGGRLPDRPLFVRVHQWAAGPVAPPGSGCPGGQGSRSPWTCQVWPGKAYRATREGHRRSHSCRIFARQNYRSSLVGQSRST